MIAVGIERDHDAIVLRRRAVALKDGVANLLRLRVEHLHAEVEEVLIERDADFGPLARQLTVLRFALYEVANRLNLLPETLVKTAVDNRALVDLHGGCDRLPQGVLRGGRARHAATTS